MRIQNISVICLLFVATAGGLRAADELPVKIGPDDARISLQGAWTDDFRGAWNGVGFKVRTDATAMNVVMDDSQSGGAHKAGGLKSNYLAIQVDDGEAVSLPIDKASGRIAVPGLDGQPHTVTVFKQSEPLFGIITFKGLELAAGGTLLDPPPPAAIRMQVIGDSISAAYGAGASGPKDPRRPETDQGWMTYWAQCARALGADVRCAAWSGQGVFRNRNGSTENQMPDVWRLALPWKDTAPERAGVDWQPTIAVINLGTNDCAPGMPTEEEYLGNYRRLVADIRSGSPACKIFACFGPMIGDPKQGQIHQYLDKLASEDDKLWVVVLTNEHGMKGVGTHWHPSILSNTTMAQQLLAAIKATE